MSGSSAPSKTSIATGAARFSDDRKYRYLLTREFGGISTCLFLMLNPSIADDVVDDPTIRRCIGFARREGFGRLEIVNLYGFMATEPSTLFAEQDPIGTENDSAIEESLDRANLVIAAWGNHGSYSPNRVEHVVGMIRNYGKRAVCFGLTKQIQPRHPLYLAANTALIEFPT